MGASTSRLFHWQTKNPWRPSEAKSDFATMFFWTGQVFWSSQQRMGVSAGGLFHCGPLEAIRSQIRLQALVDFYWETKYTWRPLEAKSDFVTMFLWTGQVFLPEKYPGHVFRGRWCERRWTFFLRNKIFLEAIRGQIRFCDNVFMNQPSILARKMPWLGELFHWAAKYLFRPLEAKSGFATMSLWTGQVFWPEKCPGLVPSGLRWEHGWTFQSQKSRLQNRNYRCGYAWKDMDIIMRDLDIFKNMRI